MKAVNSDRPISPQNMLNLLINTSFRQSECHQETQRITQQKQILLELREEYRDQIQLKRVQVSQLEHLINVRAKLRVELESLMNERRMIDRNAADEMINLKQSPVEIRNAAHFFGELEELKDQNCKMTVRLTELQDYSCKLQQKIHIMEKENRVLTAQNIRINPITGLIDQPFDQYGDLNWRQKIKMAKMEEEIRVKSWKYDLDNDYERVKPSQRRDLGPLQNIESRFRKSSTLASRQFGNRYFY